MQPLPLQPPEYNIRMNLNDHIKATNGVGREIHAFLDQYYQQYGIDHRVVLHHEAGIRLAVAQFGDEARAIAEKHIRNDWAGQISVGPDDKEYYQEAWACDAVRFLAAYGKALELVKIL